MIPRVYFESRRETAVLAAAFLNGRGGYPDESVATENDRHAARKVDKVDLLTLDQWRVDLYETALAKLIKPTVYMRIERLQITKKDDDDR